MLRVRDEERTLGPGGTWRIEAKAPHTAQAGPEGAVVIDVFSPPRDDWAAADLRA
jgi:quercetin dioxygenase-like cupin family protein